MARQRPTMQEMLRLDAIADHLQVSSRYPDRDFREHVIAACRARVEPIIKKIRPESGEEIAAGLADHFQVIFEEVHGPRDVDSLERRYLEGKKEIGFAQLRDELDQPDVDALLFQRMNAPDHAPDRWVAVLNLQHAPARGYWDRFHELAHRIAEPSQGILPFRRHRFDAANSVEALIDSVAAELAFYGPIVRPVVLGLANRFPLDFRAVDALREHYAPTASVHSAMKALAKHWPRPAVALTARFRGRRSAPQRDEALRVTVEGFNERAKFVGLEFFPNMRAPVGSPIELAFRTGEEKNCYENLGFWTTRTGDRLAPIDVRTCARIMRGVVYALVSLR